MKKKIIIGVMIALTLFVAVQKEYILFYGDTFEVRIVDIVHNRGLFGIEFQNEGITFWKNGSWIEHEDCGGNISHGITIGYNGFMHPFFERRSYHETEKYFEQGFDHYVRVYIFVRIYYDYYLLGKRRGS